MRVGVKEEEKREEVEEWRRVRRLENRGSSVGRDSSPRTPNESELGAPRARLQFSARRNHWPVLISHQHISAKN